MNTSKPKPRKKGRKSRRRLGARQYKNYSSEMLEIAVDLVRKKQISAREAARQFAIPKQTLLNKVNKCHSKSVGCPTRLSADEEAKFIKVLIAAGEFGCPLSKLDLRLVVFEYLKKNGREDTFNGRPPGKAWLDNFLSRHSSDLTIRSTQNIKKSRAEKGVEEFMEYFRNLEQTLKDVAPSNILNFDETNLNDDPGSSKCIFRRGVKYPERVLNSTKGAISLMFSVTAAGSSLPVYVVYKAENLYSEWIQGGPRDTRYNRTRSGWFDSSVFEDYFRTIILEWAKCSPGKKVIICDNLSSHLNVSVIELCECHNIQFVFIPPSSTHITQPLDVAFFAPLKKVWRAILVKYKMENPNQSTLNKNHFPKLLHSLIDQVQMNTDKNIKSGFKATGIYPFNPREVLKRVPEYHEDMASYGIDNVLLDYLKRIRQPNPMNTKRNKKVVTEPGKSVTVSDFLQTLQPSKSNARGSVKPSKSTTSLTKKKHNACDLVENLNESDNCKEKNILNEKTGVMEAIENTDFVYENDQNKPKKVNILSDIILPEKNTALICKTKSIHLKEIDKNFDMFSKACTSESKSNLTLEKTLTKTSAADKIKTINPIAVSINVHGFLSSDDNEGCMKDLDFSPNSKDRLMPINRIKRTKRRLKKSVKKENIKPVKRHKKSLDSSTTTEEDWISTHSDSDIIDALSDITNFESDTSKLTDFSKKTELEMENMPKTSREKFEKFHYEPHELEKGLQIECDYSLTDYFPEFLDEEELQKQVFHEEKHLPMNKEESTQLQKITKISKKEINKEFHNIGNEHYGDIVKQNTELQNNTVNREDGVQKTADDEKGKINIEEVILKEDMHEGNENSNEKGHFDLGDRVLVRYYKSNNWKNYVGLIENINSDTKTFTISFYKCVKKKDNIKFIKPKRHDRDFAVPEDSIVKVIELLQFNECPEEYTLMADKDAIYF